MQGKLKNLALGFAVAMAPMAAVADDIDIYVGAGTEVSAGARPNILFAIDTSGSMDSEVKNDKPFDPGYAYSGNCDVNAYYIDTKNNRRNGDLTSCNDRYLVKVSADKFVCKSRKAALASNGMVSDRFAQYRVTSSWFGTNGSWEEPEWDDILTECQSDNGVHGETDGSDLVYPKNNGPYVKNQGGALNWNKFKSRWAYSGRYINYLQEQVTSTRTRLEIVQDVAKKTLDGITRVNVGLMRFDVGVSDWFGRLNSQGGMILHEIADVEEARDDIKGLIDGLTAYGNTPLSETLLEAGNYFMGNPVDYGKDSRDQYGKRPSVPGSRTNWTYNSPIKYQCQRNFIVLLSDGEPTEDTPQSRFSNWRGAPSCSGNCLDEIAGYLYNRDLAPDIPGTQNVITYSIGFSQDADEALNMAAAAAGGGRYYRADNTEGLTSALTNIVAEVLAINTSFTAPAVSVNAFNRTRHLNQLYFTIFKPDNRPFWTGNLKRFDVGMVGEGGEIEILDRNRRPAVDPNTGFFADDAESYWTLAEDAPDGGEASRGGAAGMLSTDRNLYTDVSGNTLRAPENALHESNAAITAEHLGIDDDSEYRKVVIQWARGLDVWDSDADGSRTDARRLIGDPLHSKPVVVTYGGTEEDPDLTVFFTTNEGFLHAINGDDGSETFAYMPRHHLKNVETLYLNATGERKNYGLDGSITAWVDDKNGDGVVSDSDKVYLFFGERRGGDRYYALDVTDRSNPKKVWEISSADSAYSRLGQTWSKPALARINVGGTVKTVLVVGGGYDPAQDGADFYQPDSKGNALYIIDALTGQRLWWASAAGANLNLTEMKNGIPSDVRVIDLNSDGVADRMYVGDVGGRLWRFDIHNGKSGSELVTGGMIASLGAAGRADAATNIVEARRFFNAPDVSLVADEVGQRYLNIAIGSGNITDPLEQGTRDRFYAIKDPNVYNVPADYNYGITNDTLYDATADLIGTGDDETKAAELGKLAQADGWYINLVNIGTGGREGEKVLAESTTFAGRTYFTTFTPVGSTDTGACAPSQGLARTYIVDYKTGSAVENLDRQGTDDNLTPSDRSIIMTRGGIPPEVTILFPDASGGQPLALVGTEKLPISLTTKPVRTYWYEKRGD